MRIETVTLRRVKMPLVVTHRTANLNFDTVEHILVRAEGDGLVGWGECPTLAEPYYLNETTETTWHVLKDFIVPSVLGHEWTTVDELARRWARVKGNTFPKTGVETAAWELAARAQKTSVARLLGGTRNGVAAGVTLSIERDTGKFFDSIARALEQGYRRIKLKIAPGHDIAMLDQVRTRFPSAPLAVDANAAYTLADKEHLKQLDAFDLMMIEQPLGSSELLEHAELQRALRTAICLDESIRSVDEARLALELGSCRVVCVKVASVGGLAAAKRVHDLCRERGIPMWCGGMLDFGIGRSASIAFASLPGVTLPSDVSSSDRYFVDDIVEPPIRSVAGLTAVPTSAGFGYSVIERRIEERTVAELTFNA